MATARRISTIMYPWKLIIILVTGVFTVSTAINHWVLKDDRIIQKIDSPFFIREPDNLAAFLNQIHYNDFIESSYVKLLHQREQIVKHLRFSAQYGDDLVSQAKCAMDYYLKEKEVSYLRLTPAYLKRLSFQQLMVGMEKREVFGEPNCDEYNQVLNDPSTIDSSEFFTSPALDYLYMEQENGLYMGDKKIDIDLLRRISVEGLRAHPQSWKFHTLSSFYWRLRGNAKQSIQCARFGLIYAPRSVKDIAMLSLGSALMRMGRSIEAEAILVAAVTQAPGVPENHMQMATALAMKHDFKRALRHFEEAEKLDSSLTPGIQPVRNFIECLDNLNKRTTKMYSYVEYIKNEVKDFKKLKQEITQTHEKLVQQQVPLGARHLDAAMGSDELLKRGQFCSTRTFSNSQEPVLYCDFYSDMQMRLESKDVDIEALEKDLKKANDFVIKQVSTEFHKNLNLGQLKTTKAQAPPTDVNI